MTAEEELAKSVWDATHDISVYGMLTELDTLKVARALLSSGWAKRESVVEECAVVAESVVETIPLCSNEGIANFKRARMAAASAIRNLKAKP